MAKMKKIDGFYWKENPDWRHDRWAFQQLCIEINIFNKMAKDREWVVSMAKDAQELAATFENRNDIASILCEIELHKQAIYYYEIAGSMYDGKRNAT